MNKGKCSKISFFLLTCPTVPETNGFERMLHNYFFLKRLAPKIGEKINGLFLLECFSQNKDELILGFGNNTPCFYICANLEPNISMLSFGHSFARAGKNSIDLFPELLGEKVATVQVFDYERSFQILFEKDALIFKMHARRSNILYAKNDQIVDLFRKKLTQDLSIVPSKLHQQLAITKAAFEKSGYDPLKLLPALGKESKIYLEQQGFYGKPPDAKWILFQELLDSLKQNPIWLHEGAKPFISLLVKSEKATDDPLQAASWLSKATTRVFYFEREKTAAINKLRQKVRQSESYILKTQTKLNQIERARNPEETANILMANLHHIQKGMSRVVLHDFYTNEPLEIKLDSKLSPQKNAEVLYRKSKNRHQELDKLKENIRAKERLIEKLSRQILHIQDLTDPKQLKKYLKEHGLSEKKARKEESLPYHQFEFEGWHILLGKNAKANDELTLKHATKNDLWLHAKDVAGSHVVVKHKPGQNFPKHIIEKAAALAAANSKRKTDTLCPVIYTQKKFVRKAKGTPAGQVVVEKEEVVMVEPKGMVAT